MTLKYFTEDEFDAPWRDLEGAVHEASWWESMSMELLLKADVLRHRLGVPIYLTGAINSLGRRDNSGSMHNVKRWGEVRALDGYVADSVDAYDARRIVLEASECLFGGVGIYPDWTGGQKYNAHFGLHLDVRPNYLPGSPATWGAVNNDLGAQTYVALGEALEHLS